jgi:hypothetical protein
MAPLPNWYLRQPIEVVSPAAEVLWSFFEVIFSAVEVLWRGDKVISLP